MLLMQPFYLNHSKHTNKIYNIASGKPKKVNDVVKKLNHSTVNIKKRPGEPDFTWGNAKKANKELKWYTTIDFNDGINI